MKLLPIDESTFAMKKTFYFHSGNHVTDADQRCNRVDMILANAPELTRTGSINSKTQKNV
jgi:hypothetical protein